MPVSESTKKLIRERSRGIDKEISNLNRQIAEVSQSVAPKNEKIVRWQEQIAKLNQEKTDIQKDLILKIK